MPGPEDLIRSFVHDIRVGEHALLEFRDASQRRLAIREFVQEGLRANERTLVVAHPDTPETMQQMLAGLDGFEHAIAKGRVLVYPGQAFHESLGTPTRPSLERLHRQLVEEARKEGYEGVRGCVDVTFYADAGSPEGLERFEDAIGPSFPFAFRLLCLMDASRAAPAVARHHSEGRALRVE